MNSSIEDNKAPYTNIRMHQAVVSRAKNILKIYEDPRLRDEMHAAISTSISLTYQMKVQSQIWEVVKRQEHQLRQDQLHLIEQGVEQALKLASKEAEFVQKARTRWPQHQGQVETINLFYNTFIFAKATLTTIEQIHGQIIIGSDQEEQEASEHVIHQLATELEGMDQALDSYIEPYVPKNYLTEDLRRETKEALHRIEQIRQSIPAAA